MLRIKRIEKATTVSFVFIMVIVLEPVVVNVTHYMLLGT
jgi:hypothetical protein